MQVVKGSLAHAADQRIAAAAHGGPQLAGQRLSAGLQLIQQCWGNGDVVTPVSKQAVQVASYTIAAQMRLTSLAWMHMLSATASELLSCK
jgi:hypothetical protein